MSRLQVLLRGEWQFVFCRNEQLANPVVTDDPSKALRGDALEYFQRTFANHQFRTVEGV